MSDPAFRAFAIYEGSLVGLAFIACAWILWSARRGDLQAAKPPVQPDTPPKSLYREAP